MDLSIPKCCDFLHSSFPLWDPALNVVAAPAAVCLTLGAEHAAALVPGILSPISHILLENSLSSAGLGSPSLVWVQDKPLGVSFILSNLHISELQMVGLGFKETELCGTLMNLGWTVPLLALKKTWGEGKCFDPWGGEGALDWAAKTTCRRTSSVTSCPRWSCSPWPLLVQVQRSSMLACPRPEAAGSQQDGFSVF